MLDAKLAERIDNRVDQGGRSADRARFAGAFDAERVSAARHDIVREFDPREVVGARQAVIGQRACQKLSGLGVEHGPLEHRLPHALCHPALYLSGKQQRVNDGAEIVDDEVAQDIDVPRLGPISTSQT